MSNVHSSFHFFFCLGARSPGNVPRDSVFFGFRESKKNACPLSFSFSLDGETEKAWLRKRCT